MGIGRTVWTWGEMIKFSHSVFALPFALMAVFLAARSQGGPGAGQLALIIICMVAARSFAMTVNRLADAGIDARNPRTSVRALPAGRIQRRQAVAFAAISAALLVAACEGFRRWHGNAIPLRLAAPTLALLAGYSFSKRFTAFSHFLLGGVIGFAPLAAWIAIDPQSLGLPAVILSASVCLWIAGLDLIYACQDVEVDRREGLFSIPSRWGIGPALLLSRGCHVTTVVLLAILGRIEHLGIIYWIGLIATAVLLAIEQSLVRPNDLSRVNLAFFTLNGMVSLGLGAATIGDIVARR